MGAAPEHKLGARRRASVPVAIALATIAWMADGTARFVPPAAASENVAIGHTVVVLASGPNDPRYGAMRSDHVGLRFLWRDRGTSFLGVFADGTHELIGDALPSGVSIKSLRGALAARSNGAFAVAVFGTGGRLVHASDAPVARSVLLSHVGLAGSAPLEVATAKPIVTAETVVATVPTPRMRPITLDERQDVAIAFESASPPPIDPIETASVDMPDAEPTMVDASRVTLHWAMPEITTPRTIPHEMPRTGHTPAGESLARNTEPALPLDQIEGLPAVVTLEPEVPSATIERIRDGHVRLALRRMAPRDGFEASFLPPPGVRLLARLRFANGAPVPGKVDGLTASDACNLLAAPKAWLAFMQTRKERAPKVARLHRSPTAAR